MAAFGVWAGAGDGLAAPAAATTTSRLHWLGSRQINASPEARRFQTLWNLPESVAMQKQLLDKLAGATNATSKADARLRALLEDVLCEEFYAEVRHEPNQPGAAVFAIRLNAERARLWESNRTALPKGIELARVGEWTLLGQSPGANPLLAEWRERIAKSGAPAARGATNFWLEADMDLPAVARVLGWKLELPAGWPRTVFTVVGDGENVLTRGTLDFARPLDLKLEAWRIPTNLIREPLIGFAAARGLGPVVTDTGFWKWTQLGAAPEQMFLWAQAGVPFQTYFAGLMPGGSAQVQALSARLQGEGNAWAATNRMGSFEPLPGVGGVEWKNVPFMSPFVRSTSSGQRDYVYGGLFNLSDSRTNATLPAELLQQVVGAPRLVLYDWELTGARMESWLQITQLFRVMFRKAQLPANSAGLMWLRALTPKLGNTVTTVTQTDAHELHFTRKSTSGCTALELHLFADWMESPEFPKGLHTFQAAPGFGFGGKRPAPTMPPKK